MGDDAAGGRLLTLQEAADELKVHYMTAYRWVRRGDLPAFKAGGRLRVRAGDVERFVAARRVDVLTPGRAGRTDWPTHLDRLSPLLMAGRGRDATSLVHKVIADGAAVGEVYLELIAPALHQVGQAWADGVITVAEEHRASETCAQLLARLSGAFRRRGPSRGVAVTLTPPGELHGMAAAMLADFLRGGGYDVHHLGVNVPLEDLRRFVAASPCDLLCASITMPADPALYGALVTVADTATVVVGGQGVDAGMAGAAGALHVMSPADVVARVRQLSRS